jgi:hypothetical protein
MSLELEQVVVDALDPVALGEWWATALGWIVVDGDPEEFEIRPAPDEVPGLLFARVPEPKSSKNRVHLDLTSQSLDDQAAIVERLSAAGATRADIGQGEQTWVVMRDPEGNEFCVLAPNERFHGLGALAAIVMDSQDPAAVALFWAAATGWEMEPPDDHGDIGLRNPARPAPYLDIIRVPEEKVLKNRLHLDLRPDDRDAEVARLVGLGATRADVGQGEQSWVVLRDPEGNELCVLGSTVLNS